MSSEDDKRVWREFIESGGNFKDQTEKIKKSLLEKKKEKLFKRERKNLPRPGQLTKKIIKKFITKKAFIDATLDLHGYGRVSAKNKFIDFIDLCRNKNYRYILIITGKGKGLIREALFEWVREDEIFPLIVGYSHAHRLQGGDGAFVLHLRKL